MKEIKASDLRIGNLVSYLGENVVCDINTIWAISNIVPPTIMYQPIPLTEEWLLKLGFEKTYDEFLYDKGKFRIEFIIWADDNPEWKIKRFDGVTFSRHSEIKTKYVHQLQNLFFSLCGEELKIINT